MVFLTVRARTSVFRSLSGEFDKIGSDRLSLPQESTVVSQQTDNMTRNGHFSSVVMGNGEYETSVQSIVAEKTDLSLG